MPSPVVLLRSTDGATAEIRHDGAQVVSWRPALDGDERLFLSARTALHEGVAIRGGVPVIFPQFAAEGPLPRHGFARTMRWTLERIGPQPDGDAYARLALRDSAATRAIWPASFIATLTVRLGGNQLAITLGVENSGAAPFAFTAALHSYLRVHDVAAVALHGLQGVRYRESASPGVMHMDDDALLRPAGEVDRVYAAVPGPLLLRDGRHALEISAAGFPDAVVWNPGPAKAAALPDMEPGGERRMLCVEAAAVQSPVSLDAGARWEGTQTLRALGS